MSQFIRSTKLNNYNLALPLWRAPGVDQSHIASSKIRFSGVAMGGNFTAISRSGIGTIAGSPTSIINGYVGPAITFANTTDAITFAGNPAVHDLTKTMGVVCVLNALAGFCYFLANSSTVNTTWAIGAQAGVFYAAQAGSAITSSGITLSTNTPYFLAASTDGSTVTNFLVLNLQNGTVKTAVISSVTEPANPSNGTYRIGNDHENLALTGSISHVMYSANMMSIAAMTQWAQDPWSFWYPS